MTATRLGLWDGRFLTLFPRKLLNTATSSTLLSSQDYARLLVNMLPHAKKQGAGTMRFGMGAKGDPAGSDIIDGWDFRKSDGTRETLVYTSDGVLSRFDEGTGNYTAIKSGLNTQGLPGAVQFNGKLVFWNGLDPNFSYDGTNVVELGEFVEDDLSTDYTWVSTSSFSLKPGAGRSDYPNGRALRLTFVTAGEVTATVQGTSYDIGTNTLTVTVVGTPLPGSSETLEMVEYFDQPPPFSFIYAEHDILWALSGGLSSPVQYRGSDSLKVFHTTTTNNENSWFDQGSANATQNVAYFNIENKARIFDELLAISSFNGAMVFHGRIQTYIYVGDDPNTLGEFAYQKTLKLGLVHPKAVQQFPGDLLMVTPYGARSLTSVIQSESLEVSADLGSDVDPTISDKIVALMVDAASYRRARSFYYARDGLFGFKLDDTSLLVYALNEKSKGWSEFTGYFADAGMFLSSGDNRLLIGRGSQLYAYGNGADSAVGQVYSDGGEPISCLWWTPWLQSRMRWSNRAFEVLVEGTQGVLISLDRYINLNERAVVTTQVAVTGTGTNWDEGLWDVDTWDGDIYNPVCSDKFLADSFSIRLGFTSSTGPVNILGIRPIGR